MEKDLAAAPKQHGGEELPEPVAKIHSDGYWTEGKSFKEPLNFASMELYTADQLRTAIAAERAKSDALKTVMIAAAEEIAAHWNAHCDAEGYGPQNLMRRLEEGIPSEYGYTAGAFAELKSDADSFLWLTEDHADAETRAKCRELLGRMAVMGRGAARAAIAAERERNTAAHLACGHPAELMLRSAETGAPLYCELCDDKAGRRDAEKRESELQAELSTLRQQLAEAVRDGWTDAEADAARLALELECLLTDKDVPMPALSRWWDSAHEALELHRARFRTAIAALRIPNV